MSVMPLLANHADAGLIDLSADPINGLVQWSDIHRVKPRAPLRCRECEQSLQAKRSKLGVQFFAHDPGSTCASAGESMAHRLLKIRLANAIRDAGWVAELEVSGSGWRADVLASRPDGARRIAFEAQLASATIDELSERTARYGAEAIEVCWVSDQPKVWTTRVPSIVLQDDLITGGLAICSDLSCGGDCYTPLTGCPGHARWSPRKLPLHPFMRGLFNASVFRHRPEGTTVIWTTEPHVQRAAAAARRADAFALRRDADLRLKAAHRARVGALLTRQQELLKPAIDFLFHRDGVYVRDGSPAPEWAAGIPLSYKDRTVAVICPVASRISPQLARKLVSLTVFAASPTERQRILRACEPRQDVQILQT